MSAIFETEFRDLPLPEDGKSRMAKASSMKLVLLAIADHANDEGESAYPGLTRLERKTGLSRQGILDVLSALKYNGLLSVAESPSRLGTNDYTFNLACFPCLYGASQATLLVKPLDYPSQATLPALVKPLDLKHHLTTIESSESIPSKEKPLLKGIDAAIAMNRPVTQDDLPGPDPIEATLVELEQGLHRNIPRSLGWQELAKWINKRPSEPVCQWLPWYMEDKFRAGNAWRLTPEQVRSAWPQAFVKPVSLYKEYIEPDEEYTVIPKRQK
jgi:hypothetical protein